MFVRDEPARCFNAVVEQSTNVSKFEFIHGAEIDRERERERERELLSSVLCFVFLLKTVKLVFFYTAPHKNWQTVNYCLLICRFEFW